MAAGLKLIIGRTRQTARASSEALCQLLDHFTQIAGPVAIGASRDRPTPGSLGAWWQDNQRGPQLASYLAAVLVAEGHAQVSGTQLVFPRNPG